MTRIKDGANEEVAMVQAFLLPVVSGLWCCDAAVSIAWVRFFPLVIGAVIACLVGWGLLEADSEPRLEWLRRLEWMTYDWRCRDAAAHRPRIAENLGYVTIDEQTLRDVNKRLHVVWPFPRALHGMMVDELSAQGAAGVLFDVFFIDEDRRPHPELAALIPPAEDGRPVLSDAFFARALSANGNVILAAPPMTGKAAGGGEQMRLELPAALFRANAAGVGHAIAPRDGDGVVRRVKPFVKLGDGSKTWQMGIMLAARHLGIDLNAAAIEPQRITFTTNAGKKLIMPLDRDGSLLVNWAVQHGDDRMTHQTMGDVLASAEKRKTGEAPASVWKDKLVLVGSTGTGNNVADVGPTPLHQRSFFFSTHWNVVNSMLTAQFITRLGTTGSLGIVALLTFLAGWASWRLRVLWAVLAITGLAMLYLLAARWLFMSEHLWIPVVMPLGGALLVTHASSLVFRALIEGGRRKKVRSLFGHIVAPDTLDLLLSQPDPSWGTVRRDVTVMFADIRGFTAFIDQQQLLAEEQIRREKLEQAAAKACIDHYADAALETVNQYLTVIVDAVKKNGGTLDKYIGDCVMAFWGAPLPGSNHGASAIRAAIQAHRAVHALNLQRRNQNEDIASENRQRTSRGEPPRPLFPLLSLGTSINSGTVTVGFMGSEGHLSNYTVFGRVVNIAARLEDNASSGTIVITRSTRDAVAAKAPELAATFKDLGEHRLRGIVEAIQVFEVPWKPEEQRVNL